MTENLQEVIKKYVQGEKHLFSVIYESSYAYLHTCVIHIVKDENIALDMLQETYLEISNKMSQLEHEEKFLSWAATIANRKCFEYLKKEKRIPLLKTDEGIDPIDNISDDDCFIPEEIMQNREKQRLIREIIDGLSDVQRICIISYYYNEKKQEAIAESLGIPTNTVKTHLSRAKRKIRDAIIDLDEKQGTRLYSVSPLLMLLFNMETEACEIPPIETVVKNDLVTSNMVINGKELTKSVGRSLKVKLLIATTAIITLSGVAMITLMKPSEADVLEEATTIEMEEKNVEEDTEIPSSEDQQTPSIQEAELEEKEAIELYMEECLVLNKDEYDSYGLAIGGVIPVQRNGVWGAINFSGEIIVPLEYTGFWQAPNEQGYFVLYNMAEVGNIYYLFDKSGQLIYQGEHEVTASGTCYILVKYLEEEKSAGSVAYYNYEGELIIETKNIDATVLTANGFIDGKATIYQGNYSSDGTNIEMKVGTLSEAWNMEKDFSVFYSGAEYMLGEDLDLEYYDTEVFANGTGDSVYMPRVPMNSCNNGYYVMNNPYLLPGQLELCTEDNRVISVSNYMNAYEQDGELYFDEHYYNENNYCRYYFLDGDRYYNRGSYMVWHVGEKDYLVDLAKASEISTEMVVATHDYIGISTEKYWIIGKDGKWGYIDNAGKEMALYDDATDFYKGYALIKEGEQVFVINDNFEKTQELGEANVVSFAGELFVIETETERRYYELKNVRKEK